MSDRIAVVSGVRTPFCKSGGVLADYEADDLGAFAIQEAVARSGLRPEDVDEVVIGNVITPPQSANPARVAAVKAGLPITTSAITVSRNCASGLEAIAIACDKIRLGHAKIVVAGGMESMSHFPLLFSERMRKFLMGVKKSKGFWQRLVAWTKVRPSLFVPEMPGLTDPLCGLNMGQTAEVLVREFSIAREDQDKFALQSQQRAARAKAGGRLAEEIVPIPLPPKFDKLQESDDGIRDDQTIQALESLKPAFDRLAGTVTAGTASQVTDGAAALVLMSEAEAKARGIKPMGYITAYASTGLAPSRMGLGPAYATSKLLSLTGMNLEDFDLIEINEAFAAQVLSAVNAMASDAFAQKELGRTSALGSIDLERLNVNGGALALGHPLGASGTRMVLTLLKELHRRGRTKGLATLCVGGGQGQAMAVEVVE